MLLHDKVYDVTQFLDEVGSWGFLVVASAWGCQRDGDGAWACLALLREQRSDGRRVG